MLYYNNLSVSCVSKQTLLSPKLKNKINFKYNQIKTKLVLWAPYESHAKQRRASLHAYSHVPTFTTKRNGYLSCVHDQINVAEHQTL